ncbi:PepSY domain-containing protein [Rhodoplanes azumiensis]|uniref:PepSY domain-containing protein n=1 Tax=Rhodoplanes azumiensis TaxID=1897628 RepID=A0ABW5ARP4_9BRAD
MTLPRRSLLLASLALVTAATSAFAQRGDGPPWGGGGPPPWAGRGRGDGRYGEGRGEGRRRRQRGDHDCALKALSEGRAKPLSELLPVIEKELGGQAIDVELERCHGRIVYEVKALRPDGKLVEVKVDALTGKPIEDDD